MHCTESTIRRSALRARLGSLAGLAVLAAGCASQAPPAKPLPAPAPAAAPAPAPPPAPVAVRPPPPMRAPAAEAVTIVATTPAPAGAADALPDLGPAVTLPAPPKVAGWNDFKPMAARRMVTGSPKATYMGKPPPMLYAIAILEVELGADGRVRDISVTRPPAKAEAQDTIDIAKAAILRGQPYGDMTRLPKPWKWTEVFLFNDQRKFKPRTLD